METLYTIASVLIILFLTCEAVAGVILYRNRAQIGPRIRNFLGLDTLSLRQQSVQINVNNLVLNQERLERKINYIGRHVKFERDVLRANGILNDQTSDGHAPKNSLSLRSR